MRDTMDDIDHEIDSVRHYVIEHPVFDSHQLKYDNCGLVKTLPYELLGEAKEDNKNG